MCPTRSPSLGSNRSTCRGECSWSGPLVTPPGRCYRGPLTNGPGRIAPYCVCSGGADTVTGAGPKPLRLGPSPASPVGHFRPAPPFAACFAVVGFPSLPGGVAVVGAGLFAFPGRVACVRVPASPGCGSPPVAAGAPLPLLTEGLHHSLLRSAGLRGVVPRFRRWVLGGRAFPRHSWPRAPGAVPRHSWLGARWCWWWVAPRHSWLRVLGAVSRRSWLGSSGVGGGWAFATPG